MNKLASLLLLAVCLNCGPAKVLAQDSKRAAIKFDEFGDIFYSDKIARLDNAAITMLQQPGSKIFLIVYTTRRHLPGLNYRLRSLMKNYLVYSRGLSDDAVVTVDGGLSSNLIQQVWIVPPGTTPTPHPEIFLPQLRNSEFAWEFDDFTFGNEEGDIGYSIPESTSFEAFADEVRRSRNAIAYVIYYPGYVTLTRARYNRRGQPISYGEQLTIDSAAVANRAMWGIRKELETTYQLGKGRVRIVNGGYRGWRSVELWVLPKGAHPPVATPTRFPKKRSSRK